VFLSGFPVAKLGPLLCHLDGLSMHSILGTLFCTVAFAHPLSQALVLPSRPFPLIRLLQITLLAGPVHGVDVPGRNVELQAGEGDASTPSGHSARRDTGSSAFNTMFDNVRTFISGHKVLGSFTQEDLQGGTNHDNGKVGVDQSESATIVAKDAETFGRTSPRKGLVQETGNIVRISGSADAKAPRNRSGDRDRLTDCCAD